jgi:hypothetical protein
MSYCLIFILGLAILILRKDKELVEEWLNSVTITNERIKINKTDNWRIKNLRIKSYKRGKTNVYK